MEKGRGEKEGEGGREGGRGIVSDRQMDRE